MRFYGCGVIGFYSYEVVRLWDYAVMRFVYGYEVVRLWGLFTVLT